MHITQNRVQQTWSSIGCEYLKLDFEIKALKLDLLLVIAVCIFPVPFIDCLKILASTQLLSQLNLSWVPNLDANIANKVAWSFQSLAKTFIVFVTGITRSRRKHHKFIYCLIYFCSSPPWLFAFDLWCKVAMCEWIHQNFGEIVLMYEDRFDLRVLNVKPYYEPAEKLKESRSWWRRLTLRKSVTLQSSLCYSVISPFSLTLKRTRELMALKGWYGFFRP